MGRILPLSPSSRFQFLMRILAEATTSSSEQCLRTELTATPMRVVWGQALAGPSPGPPPGPPKPRSTSPPHLQQLDGHGVTGERLEQIQRPFLQRGEATGALEELRPPRDHPMGSPEGMGEALRAMWTPSGMLP